MTDDNNGPKINDLILNRMHSIAEDITDIKVTLAKQETSLSEHMRRSLANEESLELMKENIKPLETHVQIMNFILKAMGGLSILVSIAVGLKKLLS